MGLNILLPVLFSISILGEASSMLTTEGSAISATTLNDSTHTAVNYSLDNGQEGRPYINGKEVCCDSGFDGRSVKSICYWKRYPYSHSSYYCLPPRNPYDTYEIHCASRYIDGCYVRQRNHYCSNGVYLYCYDATLNAQQRTVTYHFTVAPSTVTIQYGTFGRVNISNYEVCTNNGYDFRSGEAVCRSKGYTYRSHTSTIPYDNYRTTDIQCPSYNITNCSIRARYSHCSSVLYIYCNAPSTYSYTSQEISTQRQSSVGYSDVQIEYGRYGRLYVDGREVCSVGFDYREGQALCQSKGYYYGSYQSVSARSHYSTSEVSCWTGDLYSCSTTPRNQYCSTVVNLYCNYGLTTEYRDEMTTLPYDTSPGYTAVRLVGSGDRSRGTIEIFHNGRWGTICDDSFDRKDGDVICRMLGYNFASRTYQGAHYGQGSEQIWLDDLGCNGYESDISYCGSRGWGTHDCSHNEDAGVDCVYSKVNTTRYETTTYNPCTSNSCYNGGTCYSRGYYYSGYYCVCPHGYTGRDCNYVATTYDPCYTSSCRNGGTCHPNYGYPGYYCLCPAGYTGQHCDTSTGFSAESVISVGCADNTWEVSVYLPPLYNRYSDFNPNDIYLGTDSCTGYVNGNYLYFRSDYSSCGTTTKTMVDNIVYTNELTYALHDPNHHFIIHEYRFRVPVDCYLARSEGSSGHFNHGHDVTIPASHHVTGSSHHTVQLQFYRDSSFTYTKPLYGSKVGDIVYVKAYTNVRDYNLKMRLSDCFTTPTSSLYSNMKYYIIRNGCAIDPNAKILSQTTHETRFYFQDFEYATNHDSLFLHCNATFCKSNDYSAACEQTCHRVQKRLGGGNIVMDGPLESTSVSDAVRLNSDGSTGSSHVAGQSVWVAVLAAVLGIFALTLAAFMILGKIRRVRRARSQVV